jgi:ATP-dependent Zn protease
VARASRLDGSKRCRIGPEFKTFDAAVRLCSKFTRNFRRQIAYHEAGHAVVAWLLGFKGVWIDMEAGNHLALVRLLADGDALLAGGGGDRAAFARALFDELVFSVAGLVAEEKIAGSTEESRGALELARIRARAACR